MSITIKPSVDELLRQATVLKTQAAEIREAAQYAQGLAYYAEMRNAAEKASEAGRLEALAYQIQLQQAEAQ